MIDTNPAGDKIGFVPEERATRGASRYDAVIATLVGLCALCVSGYTAYMQRQQVRAAVWPILGIRHQQCAGHSLYPCQQRSRTRDHPACHCKGGWAAGEELA